MKCVYVRAVFSDFQPRTLCMGCYSIMNGFQNQPGLSIIAQYASYQHFMQT